MKRITHVPTHDGAHYGYSFVCPGCQDAHTIPTIPYANGWDFDGDEERPTFSPSILVYPHATFREDGTVGETFRCHSLVRAGQIQFLNDCTHALAGQTVDLADVPEDSAE